MVNFCRPGHKYVFVWTLFIRHLFIKCCKICVCQDIVRTCPDNVCLSGAHLFKYPWLDICNGSNVLKHVIEIEILCTQKFPAYGIAVTKSCVILQEQLLTTQLQSELKASRVDQQTVAELQLVINDLKSEKTLLQLNNEKLIKAWVLKSLYVSIRKKSSIWWNTKLHVKSQIRNARAILTYNNLFVIIEQNFTTNVEFNGECSEVYGK